jgi:hypothetical protein
MARWIRGAGRANLARLLPAAVWLMAAGCQGELRTAPLTASRTPFVRDIPVPMSFELVDTMSRSYKRPGFRMIEHSYFGIAEPVTAYAFYRDEMPKCGWRLLSDQNVQGIYHLSFQKGQEAAVVVVKRDRRDLHRGTLVSISVKPIGVVITQE